MKILLVSQYYPPENVLIPSDIARHLAERGHRVRVLTGFPNYPEGKLYEGYKQRWRLPESDGSVDILRVPLYVDHSESTARRALNYLSFGASAASARGFARGADVIYVYATQMTPALGPWLWRLTGGAPYVLHVQDLWPDSITGSSLVEGGRSACVVNSILNPWLSSTYRHAAAVVGIAPTMVRTLVERGAPEDRTHLVYNWAEEDPSARPLLRHGVRDSVNVVYAGNVGDMQDLDTAVRAACSAAATGIRLTIVGDGVALPRIRALCEELGAWNVRFSGRVSREQMSAIYAQADYALVTLKKLSAFRGTIPSKFQAALSHGVPVITTVEGDLRMLVEERGLGFAAESENAGSLADAFRSAAAQNREQRSKLSARAREVYEIDFSRASGVGAIGQLLVAAGRKDGNVRGGGKEAGGL